MSLIRPAIQKFVGTSSETKSTEAPAGSLFTEIRRKTESLYYGSTWVNMTHYTVTSTAAVGNHTIALADFANKHQLCCESFDNTGGVANPSSGVITVTYRAIGSTVYIAMDDTIDLSSGPVVQLFSGKFDSLIMTETCGTSAPLQFIYTGWKE